MKKNILSLLVDMRDVKGMGRDNAWMANFPLSQGGLKKLASSPLAIVQ
jgi:hypothetical protein